MPINLKGRSILTLDALSAAEIRFLLRLAGIEQQRLKGKNDLAQFSGVPVYNGLTDEAHPTQALADFMTMREFTHNCPTSAPVRRI
jgi:ornithine carbamoyltransferase